MRTRIALHPLAAGILALCLSTGLTGCRNGSTTGTIGASVGNVLDDPDAYLGSLITVSGTVDEIFSPLLFTIEGREAGEALLVLSVDSIAPATGRSTAEPVSEEDMVQVTGRMRKFAPDRMSDEFQLDFGDIEMDDFEGQPVIVARGASATLSSIIVTPEPRSVVTPPREASLITDFAEATGDDAHALAGEAAHFQELTVAETIDESSFWVSVGEDSLLVVLISGAIEGAGNVEGIEEGQTWEVYGILREVPSSTVLITDWQLSEDLVRKLDENPLFLHGIYAIMDQ